MLLYVLLACEQTKQNEDGDDTPEAVCEETVAVECEDAIISDLALHDDKISDGDVVTRVDGDDYLTTVDATAGGYNDSQNNPWVYIKFTPDGATRVDIDDETALDSLDWDMALKRFIVRLNGGSSGGSCVGAVSFLESSYEDLTSVPDGLTFIPDAFYSSDCTIINDSSGLPSSPQVSLSPWWSYDGCVKTTMVPHLIQLADGSVLKLVVEAYYASNQQACNDGTGSGEDSANYTLRWQFLVQ